MKTLVAVAMVMLGAGPKGSKDAGESKTADAWEFEDLSAKVAAKGDTTDELSKMALAQLGIRLEGNVVLKVSAKANTVGGVTLTLQDPADPKITCALYATRTSEGLAFKDSRCSFPIFQDNLRTTATCRKISGTARRVKDTIALEATAPDCTAQPMGMPLAVRATVRPL